MRAILNGVTIAESDETVVVEGNHYFPPGSVRWECLSPALARTLCPWKGIASYFDVDAGDGARARAAAWTYRRPLPWIRRIREHVAFWGAVEIDA